MNNYLSGAVGTEMLTAGGNVMQISLDILYTLFTFMYNLLVNNVGIVVAAVVIYILYKAIMRKIRTGSLF